MKKVIVKAPIEGEIIPLEQINDEVFASGALGKGIAIRPTSERVIAPFTGTMKILFPTLHAIGLKSEDGSELLIHIGMNTVQPEGKYFIPHVKQGDHEMLAIECLNLILTLSLKRVIQLRHQLSCRIQLSI